MTVPLEILGVGALLRGVTVFDELTLDSLGVAGHIVRRQAKLVALLLVVCFVLIPLFGAAGAATATAFGLVALSAGCSTMLFRRTGRSPIVGSVLVVSASVVLGAALLGRLTMYVHSPLLRCALVGGGVWLLVTVVVLLVGGAVERAAIRAWVRGVLGRPA